jgi:sodium pump decarboxylase gamma subunit
MQLFTQALTIMAVGMALVFAFLAVVIWGMALTARIIRSYESRLTVVREAAPAADPRQLAAVIAVAVTEHQTTS